MEFDQTDGPEMPPPIAFVILDCTLRHCPIDSVNVDDVSEDMQGRDVVTYECPECKETHTSHVYG